MRSLAAREPHGLGCLPSTARVISRSNWNGMPDPARHTVHAFTAAPDGPRPASYQPRTDGRVTMAEDEAGPRPSRVLLLQHVLLL